jgi:circadian clock protein KaiC
MDTWLLVRNAESGGERNRLLFILKSRGTAHSNQVREFTLTSKGIQLTDVYIGEGEVLSGSARMVREAKDRAEALAGRDKTAQRRREIEQAQRRLQGQVNDLMAQSTVLDDELTRLDRGEQKVATVSATERKRMAEWRRAD